MTGLYAKWKVRLDRVRAVIDPETRTAALFDERTGWALGALSGLLGRELDKHPYWVFHKAHFAFLLELMRADAAKTTAERLFAGADAVADTLVANTAKFMDRYAVDGAVRKRYAGLADEERIDAGEIRGGLRTAAGPAKWRTYRLYNTVAARRRVVADLTGAYGLLGADRTRLQIALSAYR